MAGTSHDTAGAWCDSILESVRTLSAVKDAAGNTIDFAPLVQMLRQSALSLAEMFAPGDLGRCELVAIDGVPAAPAASLATG